MIWEENYLVSEKMTTSEHTLKKRRSDSLDCGYYKTSSLAGSNLALDLDKRDNWDEDRRSTAALKKLYSFDKLSLDLTNTKSDLPMKKKSDRFDKNNRLYETTSSKLDIDNMLDFEEPVKRVVLPDQWFAKHGNELTDALSMKKYALIRYIEEYPKSADLKWSLFCAACHSYRYDFVLRPFPPMFLKEDIKDIDKLRDVAETCPSMNVLHDQIEDKSCETISSDLINLLHWVLIHVKEPQLKFIPKEKHGTVLAKVLSTTIATEPNYIFQVVHTRRSEQQKFNEYAKSYRTIHAFHGTRLDNFYSILNYGLKISFTKHSSNGPGIYLSSEMNVSLPYSHAGFSWGGSHFGSQISIIALCEMIDHPDVKYADEKNKKNKFIPDLDSIPQKYFVVTNADLIRVKYLLVFSNSVPQSPGCQLNTVTTWLHSNKALAVMIAYVILLLAIATSHNSTPYKLYRRLMRRLGYKI